MHDEAVMTIEDVIDRARQTAVYDGPCEPSLIVGLAENLKGFAAAPLTRQARECAVEGLVDDLGTRMKIESYLAEHPEIEAQQIAGPLIVTGLPRTGTTACIAMLAVDPRFRFPRRWEMQAPLPPPVLEEEENDPRALAARAEAGNIDASLHLSDPDGPEEDLAFIAGYDMRHYHGRYPMPDEYLDWYFADDFSSLYRFHERFLKLLQWRRGPKFWLLKAPPHLSRLKAIMTRYSDARCPSSEHLAQSAARISGASASSRG